MPHCIFLLHKNGQLSYYPHTSGAPPLGSLVKGHWKISFLRKTGLHPVFFIYGLSFLDTESPKENARQLEERGRLFKVSRKRSSELASTSALVPCVIVAQPQLRKVIFQKRRGDDTALPVAFSTVFLFRRKRKCALILD